MRIWIQFNLLLLATYLGFFHACNVVDWPMTLGLGLGFGLLAAYLVWQTTAFRSKFERLVYLAIPLDIFLESLIPYHSGLGFYYCALAFWSLFLGYRIWLESKSVQHNLLTDDASIGEPAE